MRLLIRTDASLAIGTGHVMRCGTLAKALVEAGHSVCFLCRALPGHLIAWLEDHGLPVLPLPAETAAAATQERDAAASRAVIAGRGYDWIVVDHYELDAVWETAMAAVAPHILAIDDLGRAHAAHLLLDQNYRSPLHALYRDRVAASCEMLLGPHFALVRPDFADLRPAALARRRREIGRILLFMSGSDPSNETMKALTGIALLGNATFTLDVVIGGTNPHRRDIEAACRARSDTRLHVQTPGMAELMAAADLAVCAGGSATWERCVLGLPALVTILAPNQVAVTEAVAAAGAQRLLGRHDRLLPQDYADALLGLDPVDLERMSQHAAAICDGRGAERVVARLAQPGATKTPQLDGLHA